MKILAFNGSPRRKGNTALMLNSAIVGACAAGAEVERFDLYRMKFSGCLSCFSCKRLERDRPIVCVLQDDLRPVLEKVREVDAILIGTPVYYGCETAATRALVERLCFPFLNYSNYEKSHIKRPISVGLIYTMNVPAEKFETLGYDVTFGRTRSTLARELGECRMVMANNTTQYTDYSLYEANASAASKKAYRDAHFADDCRNARRLGQEVASGVSLEAGPA